MTAARAGAAGWLDVDMASMRVGDLEGDTAAAPGTPNVRLGAFLSLRGVTEDLTFTAIVAAPEEGAVAVQAVLELDRTRWGATYGSGKLYDRLGMHLMNDLVALQVRVVARR